MKSTTRIASVLVGSSVIVLAGCNNNDQQTLKSVQEPAYTMESLRNTLNESELEGYLKNGLKWQYRMQDDITTLPVLDDGENNSLVQNPIFDNVSNHSSTYTEESHVDESDFIDFDGQFIHTLSIDYPYADAITALSIQHQTDYSIVSYRSLPTTSSAEKVNTIDLDDSRLFNGIYAVPDAQGSRLAVLSSSGSHATVQEENNADDSSLSPQSVFVDMYAFDASGKSSMDESIQIEGTLLSSRRIGNKLYVISRFTPSIEGLTYTTEEAIAIENQERIDATPLHQLLPKVKTKQSTFTLNNPESCYLPASTQNDNGYHNIVSITSILMDSGTVEGSTCALLLSNGYYVSNSAFYLLASNVDKTALHQFKFDPNGLPQYMRSGFVDGRLGRSGASFRVNQKDDMLRILTTKEGFEHQLTILKEKQDTLEYDTLSYIPNDRQPASIGKPGEDIFGARFIGDRAYVVTFLNQDPFYVIDLSEPETPSIAGALEIPGFSTLLHPVNDNYVLGIGSEQAEAERVKVELFDVTDISTPLSKSKFYIGDFSSRSEVLHNHRALTLYKPDAQSIRFALPADRYSNNFQWQDKGLHLFEINAIDSDNASMRSVGEIIAFQLENDIIAPFTPAHNGRSLVNDDTIHYLQGSRLLSAPWSDPSRITPAP